MTTAVVVTAHVPNDYVVTVERRSEGGASERIASLKDGETHTAYVYNDHQIVVRERPAWTVQQ
jgi:hypothetical protein